MIGVAFTILWLREKLLDFILCQEAMRSNLGYRDTISLSGSGLFSVTVFSRPYLGREMLNEFLSLGLGIFSLVVGFLGVRLEEVLYLAERIEHFVSFY